MDQATSDWRRRATNLLDAARDVTLAEDPPPTGPLPPAHAELFARYVKELRRAKGLADGWWEAVVATEQTRAHDRNHALRVLRERFPAGAVGDLRVVAVVRRYWLACAGLNAAVGPAERVPPEQFLLGHLIGGRDEDLAAFLAGLPYWPVTMDVNGNWF